MIAEIVALLMIIDHEIKEHRIQPSMSECLKGIRIAMRKVSDNVEEGDPIMTLDADYGFDMHLLQRLKDSIKISEYQVKDGLRVLETITIENCS